MKSIALLLMLALSCLLRSAQNTGALPKSEDYPVTERFTGKNAKLVLDAKGRTFRTRLREGSQNKVNFAGHYVLTTWGCGAECVMGAAIDAKSGKVYWLPFTVCCWPLEVEKPLDFRLDSNLIVFTGSRNEEGQGVYYYKFENNSFTLLKAIEKKQ